jgi:hypothetical protein
MVFLWACQMSGSKHLATQGLDTFDLATPVLAEGRGVAPSPRPAAARRAGCWEANRRTAECRIMNVEVKSGGYRYSQDMGDIFRSGHR